MYYNFSFCDNIQVYKNEIDFLDKLIGANKITVHNATTLPFAFALSNNRKLFANFNHMNLFFMFAAFETEKDRFLTHIKRYLPFDEEFINFALNREEEIDPWKEAIISYLLCYASTALCSFDGPFDDVDFSLLKKHLNKISRCPTRNISCHYKEVLPTDGINLFEFPESVNNLPSNSIIITNKSLNDKQLLFEDKLKIYGV